MTPAIREVTYMILAKSKEYQHGQVGDHQPALHNGIGINNALCLIDRVLFKGDNVSLLSSVNHKLLTADNG